LCHSPNIARVNKSRKLRWTDQVTRGEEAKNVFKILKANLLERDL